MFNKIYSGMTAGELINRIQLECDTSAGLRQLSDSELISVYISVFGEEVVK
jgi:hypothetical protein